MPVKCQSEAVMASRRNPLAARFSGVRLIWLSCIKPSAENAENVTQVLEHGVNMPAVSQCGILPR